MRTKIYPIVFSLSFSVTDLALSEDTMIFDANGRRLNLPEEPSIQYQWTYPKTGKIVTREYPPANLQMRQVERRGNLVILEVIEKHKFADAVNLATPKSVEALSSGDPIKNCFSAVKAGLKDPYSAILEGGGPWGFTTETGAVRQQVVISVNAKNSYGAYTGSKSYTCVLQMDNVTVSHVK